MSLGMQQYVWPNLQSKTARYAVQAHQDPTFSSVFSSIFIFQRNFTEQEADMLGMHNRRVNVMVNSATRDAACLCLSWQAA